MRRLSITAALFLGTAVAFAAMDPFDGLTVPAVWGVSVGGPPAAPRPTARASCPDAVVQVRDAGIFRRGSSHSRSFVKDENGAARDRPGEVFSRKDG